MSKHEVTQAVRKVAHNRRFQKILLGLAVLALGIGLLIVPVESRSGSEGNIRDAEDGIWWAVTTMTGVGYGDTYPVTTLGRFLGILVEVFGVILFGSIVAIVSVELLRYQEDYYVRRMFKRTDELEMKIDGMKKHLDYLVQEKMGKN